MDPELLRRLARAHGIQLEFTCLRGERHAVSLDTVRALLGAMGVDVADEGRARAALHEAEVAPWRRALPPILVLREDRSPARLPLTLPAHRDDAVLAWRIVEEGGHTHGGTLRPHELAETGRRDVDGVPHVARALPLQILPAAGYHRFEIDDPQGDGGPPASTLLVVTPARSFVPDAVAEGRVWGPTVHLPGIRTENDWEIGDFGGLRALVDAAATLGADLVGTTPLAPPEGPCPYRASDRSFLDPLSIDVEALDDLRELAAAGPADSVFAHGLRLRALAAGDVVDRAAVATEKRAALATLFDHFRAAHLARDTERARAFRAFCEARRPALDRFALFEALRDEGGQPPAPWDASDEPRLLGEHADAVQFHAWAQWLAASQLDAAGARCVERHLGLGLYIDVPVSAATGGAEAWRNAEVFASGARVGAPPDDAFPRGQDWGLVPYHPAALHEAACAPFVETLRAVMRPAGAVRLVHAAGLGRLFWIPEGASPADGTYVDYRLDDLLGLVVLESHRNRCLVVGEDLGAVPDWLSARLRERGLCGARLLPFERGPDGAYRRPRDYPKDAHVAVSNHDLPTVRGRWEGHDLVRREEQGRYGSPTERYQEGVARSMERALLLVALAEEELLPDGISVDPATVRDRVEELSLALHRFVARTPARLMTVQLEDALGSLDGARAPGTDDDETPNWCRRLPVDATDLARDERVVRLADAVRAERRASLVPATEDGGVAAPPSELRVPRATYRLQLTSAFTFDDAAAVVPYLDRLGVSHAYCSPYLMARPGSPHGYDIIDHGRLNPELGGEAAFGVFCRALAERGMSQIVDFVPNHMGVGGNDNAWWLDVLENGQTSIYADHFDIDWEPSQPELHGKVLVPVLGDAFGAILDRGELRLRLDADEGSFSVWYWDHRLPLDPRTYRVILERAHDRIVHAREDEPTRVLELDSLATAFRNLPAWRDEATDAAQAREERNRDKELLKRRFRALLVESPEVRRAVDRAVAELNGVPGTPASFDDLERLLAAQRFRLSYWRVASDEINYRRFFDINDLAAIRMERRPVFDETHALLFRLVGERVVDGLRIDHPDGLYDPATYYRRLQESAAEALGVASPDLRSFPRNADEPPPRSLWVVIEKILAPHESLPAFWPVSGTTGYEFANLSTGLLVDAHSEEALTRVYARFIGERPDFDELAHQGKMQIMRAALAGELNVLANQLRRITLMDRYTRDFTRSSLRAALREVVACFPVYRTYVTERSVDESDRRYVDWAVSQAKKRSRASDLLVFDFIRDVLLLERPAENPRYRDAVVRFAMRFQQYTAPVEAKGLEDTTFYIDNRLACLNEVGGDPRRYATSIRAFHHANRERARHWPHTMLCTSTHDTKRSEDVRARIAALSELPRRWREHLARWSRVNRRLRTTVDGVPAPSRNDRYLLYQTLVGAWPLELLDPEAFREDEAGREDFRERIEGYMLKAVREAKVRTSWINPNVAYEDALVGFVRGLLAPGRGGVFREDFLPFARRVARLGMFNSLAVRLLAFTAPGVPDLYQGNELWDFSLVDPDNRRPVDFARRRALLDEIAAAHAGDARQREAALRALVERLPDGRAKLFVTWRALALRRQWPDLFRDGDYVPLGSGGTHGDRVCAFARALGRQTVIVVVPRLLDGLLTDERSAPLGADVWHDTWVEAPRGAFGVSWRDTLSGADVGPVARDGGEVFLVADLLARFPVALLSVSDASARPQRAGAVDN